MEKEDRPIKFRIFEVYDHDIRMFNTGFTLTDLFKIKKYIREADRDEFPEVHMKQIELWVREFINRYPDSDFEPFCLFQDITFRPSFNHFPVSPTKFYRYMVFHINNSCGYDTNYDGDSN